MRLAQLWRYPLKSGRGVSLDQALVEPWGLAGDRRWMVVDVDGTAITARERPELILTEPTATATQLTLHHPRLGSITVPVPTGDLVQADVWGTPVLAAHAPAADAFVSAITGQPARLVFLDDPTRRRPNPARSAETDRVSLADSFPLLLASLSSLAVLNDWITEGPRAEEGPVPIRRFRPNLVIDDARPWDEDRWRRVRIGAVTFRAVKACDRCVLTTVDPDTAVKGKEPITSLARHRRWDGKTWFAINLIPDDVGPLHIGDEIEVLESVESFEPQR